MLRLPTLRPPSRFRRWRHTDGEAELRENRENRRRRFHRFIADADPARRASAPAQRAPHEAGETPSYSNARSRAWPRRPIRPKVTTAWHGPNRSWSAASDQNRKRFSAGARLQGNHHQPALHPTRLRSDGIPLRR
jgi:hypothetical protein